MEIVKCDLPCDRQGEPVKLSKPEVVMLEYRFEFKVETLCQDHYRDQFSRYPGWHKKCVDPCSRHSKPAKTKLSEISLDFANKVKSVTEHRVIPGQKLCRPCALYLNELISTSEQVEIENVQQRDASISDEIDSQELDQSDSLM